MSDKVDSDEVVVVNENENGEATNGTTQQGDTSEVKNTDSIPQNGVTEIETTPAPNDIAREADEARTEKEIKFADESNPNQKARNASAPTEYDQDGNLRSSGYSYGVAADDLTNLSDDAFDGNKGEKPEEPKNKFENKRVFVSASNQNDTVNTDDTNVEVTPEDVEKLEKELSDESNGLIARVISSTGSYWKIKFFKNNKPFVTYKARTNKLDKKEVKAFVKNSLKEAA